MLTKTSLLFLLYFSLMLVAVAYAYILITSLVTSYQQPVRSVMYIYKKAYDPPAIIIYPEYNDTFVFCDFYVKKNTGDEEVPVYDNNNCSIHEYSYFSRIHDENRRVLVFKGPSKVSIGEKNKFYFLLNLSNRTYSNLDYRVYDTYECFMTEVGQKNMQDLLLRIEMDYPLYRLAGDFVNFVKLDKTIDTALNNQQSVTFQVEINLARLIPRANDITSDEVVAFFEWGDPILEESQEIISTTIWNTLGSLCAMFLALAKVWGFGKNWILKIWRTYKRDVKYKKLHSERREFLKTLDTKEQDGERKEEM